MKLVSMPYSAAFLRKKRLAARDLAGHESRGCEIHGRENAAHAQAVGDGSGHVAAPGELFRTAVLAVMIPALHPAPIHEKDQGPVGAGIPRRQVDFHQELFDACGARGVSVVKGGRLRNGGQEKGSHPGFAPVDRGHESNLYPGSRLGQVPGTFLFTMENEVSTLPLRKSGVF